MTAVCVDKKLNAQPIICPASSPPQPSFPHFRDLKTKKPFPRAFLFISGLWVLLHKYCQSGEFSNRPRLISISFLCHAIARSIYFPRLNISNQICVIELSLVSLPKERVCSTDATVRFSLSKVNVR